MANVYYTYSPSGSGGSVGTVTQGSPGTASGAWFMKLVDVGGTNIAHLSQVGATYALDVNVVQGTGSGFSVLDASAWTAGVSPFAPTGGVYNDSAANLSTGTQGTLRLTTARGLHVNLRDAAGVVLIGQQVMTQSLPVVFASNQTSLPITAASLPLPAGAATELTLAQISAKLPTTLGQKVMTGSLAVVMAADQSAIPTSNTALSLTQGAALTGQVGPMVMGSSTSAAPTYTTATVNPFSMNLSGGLRSDITQVGGASVTLGAKTTALSIPVTLPTDQGGLTVSQATASNLNAQVVGNVASLTTDSGNPVKVGGLVAATAAAINGSNGQRADLLLDRVGRAITTLSPRGMTFVTPTTIASTTETAIVAASGTASVFRDLTQLVLTNSSATAVNVTIRSGTGGTTMGIISLAANGGAVIPFITPLPQVTANTPWTAQLSAAVTSVNIIAVSMYNF